MLDHRLQVYKPYEMGDSRGKYRLAVIDPNNRHGFPANFVCLLPETIHEKGKPMSLFKRIFGDKSYDYAADLLTEALKQEKDQQVKTELEKRLKTLTNGSRPAQLLKYKNANAQRRIDLIEQAV